MRDPQGTEARLPTFLGIGASRSGTTWLHANLGRHPEVWLTPVKEVHYFDTRHLPRWRSRYYREQLRKCVQRYGDLPYLDMARRRDAGPLSEIAWDAHFFLRRRNNAWYTAVFRPRAGQIAGEITPAYSMLDVGIVEEIGGINPDLKVIYLLRDPVDRSWSSAVTELRRRNRRPVASIPDEEFFLHFNSVGHMLRRDYLRALGNWEGVFGREQVFVGFLDDIEQRPREFLPRLYRFLGVSDDEAHIPGRVSRRVNVSRKRRAEIPERFEAYLANMFLPQLTELSERFGEPATGWLRRAEEALAAPRGREYALRRLVPK
jgi:Sulfotransferase family